jgi:hypothetical protein
MEVRNLTLQITNRNWKNWVWFLLKILPLTREQKIIIINKIRREIDG